MQESTSQARYNLVGIWLVRITLLVIVAMVLTFGVYQAYRTLTSVRAPYDQPLFDEPLFAEMSRVAARGGTLYVDQWDHKPPVLFWILSGFIRLIGNNMLSIKVATMAVNLVFVALISALSHAIVQNGRDVLWNVPAIFLVFLMMIFAFTFSMWQSYLEGYNSVFIMATLSTAAMLAAVLARGRPLLLLLSGVLLAFSFFTKQVMIMEAFAALAFAAYYAPQGKRVRSALWVVFGGLIGVGGFVGWMAYRGALYDLWYGSFYTGLLYTFEPEGRGWHFNTEFFEFFDRYFVNQALPFMVGLFIMSVPAVIVLLRERETRVQTLIILLWVGGAFFGAALGRSLRRQYFIEMIPPLLLLNVYAVVIYARWRWHAQLAVIGLLAFALYQNGILRQFDQTLTGIAQARWQSPDDNIDPFHGGENAQLMADFVSDYLEPGECIWNWDGMGFINYLSDHPSCTSAPHATALMVRESFDIPVNRAEYMNELIAVKPRLHIKQPIWGYFPELERFANRYVTEQLITLDETNGFVEVYAVDMASWHDAFANFNDLFHMVSYDLNSEMVCTGDSLDVSMTWQLQRPPERYYNLFVQLLTDDQTAAVASVDAQPLSDLPTIEWTTPNMLYLSDAFTLTIPNDVPSGDYPLVMGFYDTETFERIPVFDGNGRPMSGNYVILTTTVIDDC